MLAGLAKNAFFDRVPINFAGALTSELLEVGIDILRQGFLENRPARQILRGKASQATQLRVQSQYPAVPVDLGNSSPDMLGRGEPIPVSPVQFKCVELF